MQRCDYSGNGHSNNSYKIFIYIKENKFYADSRSFRSFEKNPPRRQSRFCLKPIHPSGNPTNTSGLYVLARMCSLGCSPIEIYFLVIQSKLSKKVLHRNRIDLLHVDLVGLQINNLIHEPHRRLGPCLMVCLAFEVEKIGR